MRHIIYLISCICLVFVASISYANDSQPVVIRGQIKGANDRFIFISYSTGIYKTINDSAWVKNGAFEFKGLLPNPVLAVISLGKDDTEDYANIFIEPGEIKVRLRVGRLGEAEVAGSKSHLEYMQFRQKSNGNKIMQQLIAESNRVNEQLHVATEAGKDSTLILQYSKKLDGIQAKIAPLLKENERHEEEYIRNFPDSYVSGYLLSSRSEGYSTGEAEEAYGKLSNKIKQSTFGLNIAEIIRKSKLGTVGDTAYIFERTDIDGKHLSLADYRGKYVLLDFWASWCVPCRKSNPHLIKIYNQFKSRGFEIIGILDDDKDPTAGKAAVAKDGVGIWRHVLRGFDSEKLIRGQENPNDISLYYNIKFLPTKILIDREGRVVSRFSMDDTELEEKLSQLLPRKNNLTLDANFTGLKDSVITIEFSDDKGRRSAEVSVKDGKFQWKQMLNEPQRISLLFKQQYLDFFVDNADIKIYGNMDSLDRVKMTGSPLNDEFWNYYTTLSPILNKRQDTFQELMKVKNDKKLQAEFESKITELNRSLDAKKAEYIGLNPGSPISIDIVEEFGWVGEARYVDSLYNLLSAEARMSAAGKRVKERIEVLRRGEVGSKIKDFEMTTINGKTVNISDFKGKYVFIDFWASWCGPCRQENPNVLNAYNRFKNKNFVVLGISIDKDAKQWKEAVTKDKMPWTQVREKVVADYYGIEAIPATFLLNPQGTIIHKGLRGQELHRVLEKILGK